MAGAPSSGRDPLIDSTVDGRWRMLHAARRRRRRRRLPRRARRASAVRWRSSSCTRTTRRTTSTCAASPARRARSAACSTSTASRCSTSARTSDRPYIVMELVAGAPLHRGGWHAGDDDRRAPSRLMRQVLLGLGHAHGHGIIHRDLKPDNIIDHRARRRRRGGQDPRLRLRAHQRLAPVAVERQPRAGDAELHVARAGAGRSRPIRAPTSTRRACMLYELCVGFKPFVAARAVAELLQKHQRRAAASRRGRPRSGGGISEPLERVILRALPRSRDERFPDAAAFVAALDATPEGAGARAPVRTDAAGDAIVIATRVVAARSSCVASAAIAAATRLRRTRSLRRPRAAPPAAPRAPPAASTSSSAGARSHALGVRASCSSSSRSAIQRSCAPTSSSSEPAERRQHQRRQQHRRRRRARASCVRSMSSSRASQPRSRTAASRARRAKQRIEEPALARQELAEIGRAQRAERLVERRRQRSRGCRRSVCSTLGERPRATSRRLRSSSCRERTRQLEHEAHELRSSSSRAARRTRATADGPRRPRWRRPRRAAARCRRRCRCAPPSRAYLLDEPLELGRRLVDDALELLRHRPLRGADLALAHALGQTSCCAPSSPTRASCACRPRSSRSTIWLRQLHSAAASRARPPPAADRESSVTCASSS